MSGYIEVKTYGTTGDVVRSETFPLPDVKCTGTDKYCVWFRAYDAQNAVLKTVQERRDKAQQAYVVSAAEAHALRLETVDAWSQLDRWRERCAAMEEANGDLAIARDAWQSRAEKAEALSSVLTGQRNSAVAAYNAEAAELRDTCTALIAMRGRAERAELKLTDYVTPISFNALTHAEMERDAARETVRRAGDAANRLVAERDAAQTRMESVSADLAASLRESEKLAEERDEVLKELAAHVRSVGSLARRLQSEQGHNTRLTEERDERLSPAEGLELAKLLGAARDAAAQAESRAVHADRLAAHFERLLSMEREKNNGGKNTYQLRVPTWARAGVASDHIHVAMPPNFTCKTVTCQLVL